MMPATEVVARQIALVKQLHPEWTISEIARYIYLPQVFIINGLYKGVDMELFTWDRKKDQIELTSTDWYGGCTLGTDIDALAEAFLTLVQYNNNREEDIALDKLASWCTGINPMGQELAVFKLGIQKKLTSYKLIDPKDKKSEYEFITLPENLEHQWGWKQFRSGKKK